MELNIGPGAEVKLRLRRPNREWDFFPYEQILDTMLHELCHNEHGPYNALFYNLLVEIRKRVHKHIHKQQNKSGKGEGCEAVYTLSPNCLNLSFTVHTGVILADPIRLYECEEVIAKGISGTEKGLDISGRCLSGFSRQLPLSSLRQTALAAAESRMRLGALLPSGAQFLGGDSSIKSALSPTQAAAMAAER